MSELHEQPNPLPPCARGCLRRGDHYAACPSYGLDDDTGCTGCAPRAAAPGLALCGACLHRIRTALAAAPDTLAQLRTIADPGRASAPSLTRANTTRASRPRDIVGADVLDADAAIAGNLYAWAAHIDPHTPRPLAAGASPELAYVVATRWAATIADNLEQLVIDPSDGLRLTEATIVHHAPEHGEGRREWSLVDAKAQWIRDRETTAEPRTITDFDGELAAIPIAEWGAEILRSTQEAAERAGVSFAQVNKWIRAGILQPVMTYRGSAGHTAHAFRAVDVDRASTVMRARLAMRGRKHATTPLEDLRRLEEAEAAEEAAEAESGRAFDELRAALASKAPGCLQDATFTADEYGPTETAALAAVCAACPAIEQCRAYAIATQPSSGFWAGAPAAAYAST